ncbi:hypothetical protein [Psychroflexus aestuariivivens]|uniref:hypothetical protein n=1 Tax=Psychroflexus aestuariivivens TaxID=1795040 RepID=UPI000FD9E47F|nr:hypothetical protein [Psychroflexus aestuariivivens]
MTYWEILLTAQKKKGKSGLTIPFLIGSQLIIKNKADIQNIKDLILDIVENSSFEVNLRYCINCKTLILEKRNIRNYAFFQDYNNKPQSNLSIAKFHKNDLGTSIEDLIISLESKFNFPIKNKTFSSKPNPDGRIPEWEFFSNEDIKFISQEIIK